MKYLSTIFRPITNCTKKPTIITLNDNMWRKQNFSSNRQTYLLQHTNVQRLSWRTSGQIYGRVWPRHQLWPWCCWSYTQPSAPWPGRLLKSSQASVNKLTSSLEYHGRMIKYCTDVKRTIWHKCKKKNKIFFFQNSVSDYQENVTIK